MQKLVTCSIKYLIKINQIYSCNSESAEAEKYWWTSKGKTNIDTSRNVTWMSQKEIKTIIKFTATCYRKKKLKSPPGSETTVFIKNYLSRISVFLGCNPNTKEVIILKKSHLETDKSFWAAFCVLVQLAQGTEFGAQSCSRVHWSTLKNQDNYSICRLSPSEHVKKWKKKNS